MTKWNAKDWNMNRSFFFQNILKFEKNQVNVIGIYMNGLFFLGKLVYVWFYFQILSGKFQPKPNLSTPRDWLRACLESSASHWSSLNPSIKISQTNKHLYQYSYSYQIFVMYESQKSGATAAHFSPVPKYIDLGECSMLMLIWFFSSLYIDLDHSGHICKVC